MSEREAGTGAGDGIGGSRVQAVVLDLDGTLFDHVGSVRAALRAWLPSLGAEATDALVTAWFAAEERHFRAWCSREVSFAEQRRRRLREVLPLAGLQAVHLDRTGQGPLDEPARITSLADLGDHLGT